MLQYREVIGGEVRTFGDDNDHQIEAKVCSYGVGPDTYNTTWQPGCFRSALDAPEGGLPAVCWSHQPDSIIGSVTGYTDNPDGLYVQMRMANFDEVPKAKEAYSLVRDGHVKGWSFGFTDGETEPDPDHEGAMRFRSARMYEVSPVLRASVPLTKTIAVRSADGESEAATDTDLERVISAGVRAALSSDKPLVIGDRKDPDNNGDDDEPSVGDSVTVGKNKGKIIKSLGGGKWQVKWSTGKVSTVTGKQLDPDGDGVGGRTPEPVQVDDSHESDRPDLEPLLRAIVEANDYAQAIHREEGDLMDTLRAEAEGIQALAEALGYRDSKKPYGDVTYADPKNGKYPIDTEEHARAAWAYINKDENAGKYPLNGVTLEEVKSRIRAAAKKFKINLAASAGGSAGDSPETKSDSPSDSKTSRDDDDTLTRLTLIGLRH